MACIHVIYVCKKLSRYKLFKMNFDPWNKLPAQLKGKFSSNTL